LLEIELGPIELLLDPLERRVTDRSIGPERGQSPPLRGNRGAKEVRFTRFRHVILSVRKARAAASVTMPRIPHQPITAAARVERATVPAAPRCASVLRRHHQRPAPATPATHTMRATIVVAQTAAEIAPYSISSDPSSRSRIDFSWRPIAVA
jgi:hypothetical protein